MNTELASTKTLMPLAFLCKLVAIHTLYKHILSPFSSYDLLVILCPLSPKIFKDAHLCVNILINVTIKSFMDTKQYTHIPNLG